MMKIAAAACLALLAACTSTPGPNIGVVDDVLTLTRKGCGYLPTVATVTAILGQAIPGLSTATQVAGAICTAVTPSTSARSAGVPTVAGVPIQGEFVK